MYELGPGKGVHGGKYMICSGDANSVVIPVTNKTILISHTYPNGTALFYVSVIRKKHPVFARCQGLMMSSFGE